ncbi:hypothetical protein D3C78_1909520 [compost metagenome]
MPAFQPFCGACHQAQAPSSTASPAHGNSNASAREGWSRCHFTSGPNGSSITIGAINSRNRLPKYGGPTEILPSDSASASSG